MSVLFAEVVCVRHSREIENETADLETPPPPPPPPPPPEHETIFFALKTNGVRCWGERVVLNYDREGKGIRTRRRNGWKYNFSFPLLRRN